MPLYQAEATSKRAIASSDNTAGLVLRNVSTVGVYASSIQQNPKDTDRGWRIPPGGYVHWLPETDVWLLWDQTDATNSFGAFGSFPIVNILIDSAPLNPSSEDTDTDAVKLLSSRSYAATAATGMPDPFGPFTDPGTTGLLDMRPYKSFALTRTEEGNPPYLSSDDFHRTFVERWWDPTGNVILQEEYHWIHLVQGVVELIGEVKGAYLEVVDFAHAGGAAGTYQITQRVHGYRDRLSVESAWYTSGADGINGNFDKMGPGAPGLVNVSKSRCLRGVGSGMAAAASITDWVGVKRGEAMLHLTCNNAIASSVVDLSMTFGDNPGGQFVSLRLPTTTVARSSISTPVMIPNSHVRLSLTNFSSGVVTAVGSLIMKG